MADLTNKPFLKTIRDLLSRGIQMIDNNQCDEAQAAAMISRYNAEAKGFYDEHSLVNYDKAAKILGIKNRNKLKEICSLYHIEQKKLNNMPVGFLRSEIEDLATRLRSKNKGGH